MSFPANHSQNLLYAKYSSDFVLMRKADENQTTGNAQRTLML